MKKVEEQLKKAEQLIKQKEVKDTPFVVVSIKEQNVHFGALGEYRITEKYDNPDVAEKEVKKMTWENIIKVVSIIFDKLNQVKK